MSASLIGRLGSSAFRLSTTPVSMSLAGSRFSSDSAPRALPSWDSKTRWNNLSGDLAVNVMAGSSGHTKLTSSIVPRGTSFHRWVELDLVLSHLILHRSQAAATSLVHRNSVPLTHTRCMITANRRASATIAFFIPRCLATFIAQALSQDHFVERINMLWAAS